MSFVPLLRATPSEVGMDPVVLKTWFQALDQRLDEVHSVVVVRHGKVAAEAWWNPYKPELPHALYSLTKSFTSTAVGFAVAEGLVDLDSPVVEYLGPDGPSHPNRFVRALTVRHLLTMSTGRLTDSIADCFADPRGNWVKGFFRRPWRQAPGAPFVYDTGASHLLGAVVTRATGKDLVEYLTPRLFAPLGFGHFHWDCDPKGLRTGGFGLRLRTEDVAKFDNSCFSVENGMGKQSFPNPGLI